MKLVLIVCSLFSFLTNAHAGREGHGLLPPLYICASEEQKIPEVRVEFVISDSKIVAAHLFKDKVRPRLFDCIDRYSPESLDEQLRPTVECRPSSGDAIEITLKESLSSSMVILEDRRQMFGENLTGSYSCF